MFDPFGYKLPYTDMGRYKDFDELYRAQFDMVCNLVRHHGVPAGDAEDVAQEAFLKLDKLRDRYPQAEPVALLCTIAKNTARDFRKTDPGRKPVPAVEAAPPATPEDQMRQGEGQAVFARIIRELPPELRTVYVMADLQEVQLDKIAEDLRIPLGTVKSRLATARAAIDAILKQLARTNQLPAVLLSLVLGRPQKPAWREKLSVLKRATTIGLAALLPIVLPLAYLPLNAAPIPPEQALTPENTRVAMAGSHAGTGPAQDDPQSHSDAHGPPVAPKARTGLAADGVARSSTARGRADRSVPAQEREQRDREMMWIQNARLAWSIGDTGRALAELSRHKELYPNGYMAQERDELIALIEQQTAQR